MRSVRFARLAEDDLRSIGQYIAKRNPDRATTFVIELRTLADRISQRPLSFPSHDRLGSGLRGTNHGSYRVFFRITEDEIVIIRILHSARNIAAIAKAGGLD